MTIASDLVLVAATAVAGALAIMVLGRRESWAVPAGVVLIVAAGSAPLFLAYGFGLGLIGVVAGGAAAALRAGWSASGPRRLLLAVAVVWLAVEPLTLLTAYQIQADESFDRCAAGKAIAIAETSRAAGEGYPATMHDIAVRDDSFGTGTCFVSSGVNWLYRLGPGGTYTLGYWVDWRLARRVCLHSSGAGWSCGFESWGPFRPGEVD